MLKQISRTAFTVLAALAFLSVSPDATAQSNLTAKSNGFQPVREAAESDRIKDGLIGPVRRVRTEIVKLASADGKVTEGKRALLEVVAYDIKGNKTENQYYPVAGATLTGKEVYKYDDKGNISEMTMFNDDGSLLSKETYKYEFDFAGNWNKMTTSVAVVDGGRFTFEPTEITYRSIMYYLDANMVKMAQPTAQPAAASPAPSNSSKNVAKVNPDTNGQPATESPAIKQAAPIQKSAASLPPPSTVSGKTSVVNSAELTNVAINSATNQPLDGLESEPPPTPAPRPILKPVSGGVLNGTAISLPTPLYPDTARRMRTDGTVTVEVVIDENGKVISAQASSGPTTLREAAVQAALRARFSPTKLSGQPVKVSGVINYKFALSR
ncbi:MAG: energy transducer TonB [Pyrinomonadaceae bacterium]